MDLNQTAGNGHLNSYHNLLDWALGAVPDTQDIRAIGLMRSTL